MLSTPWTRYAGWLGVALFVLSSARVVRAAEFRPLNFNKHPAIRQATPDRPAKGAKSSWPIIECGPGATEQCVPLFSAEFAKRVNVKTRRDKTPWRIGSHFAQILDDFFRSQFSQEEDQKVALEQVKKDLATVEDQIGGLRKSMRDAASPTTKLSLGMQWQGLEKKRTRLKAKLRSINQNIVTNKIQITEAWPAEDDHDSVCHDTGCALDLTVSSTRAKNALWKAITSYYDQHAKQGAYPFCYLRDEYRKPTSTTTRVKGKPKGNIHLEGWGKVNALGQETDCGLCKDTTGQPVVCRR